MSRDWHDAEACSWSCCCRGGRRWRRARPAAPSRAARPRRGRRLGCRRRVLPAGAAGRSRSRRLQDRARARDVGGVAACTSTRGREAEEEGQLEEALREYRKALEFEPSNRQVAAKAAEIERILRDRIEAARPRPEIEKTARAGPPAVGRADPQSASREPLASASTTPALRDVLNFIGDATGINVTFDRDFQDRTITLTLEGVTLEQALQQIMIANQLFYKVLNERTILVAATSTAEAHAVRRAGGPDVLPVARRCDRDVADAHRHHARRRHGHAADRSSPTRRATRSPSARPASVMQIIERMIDGQRQAARRSHRRRADSRSQPRAGEAVRPQPERLRDRRRFSPEVAPAPAPQRASVARRSTSTPFRPGVSTADFYLSVPTAVMRFLESDSQTKVLAKPQLRGTEGPEDVAQPRRRRAGAEHHVHAARRRRRGGQPADVVRLSHRSASSSR